ncbi:unnamed protein product [Sympodiomycopsis kandeliae]
MSIRCWSGTRARSSASISKISTPSHVLRNGVRGFHTSDAFRQPRAYSKRGNKGGHIEDKALKPVKNPVSPIHIYRCILRNAQVLAKRWSDPYIFWTYKHIASRDVGVRFDGENRKLAHWVDDPKGGQAEPSKAPEEVETPEEVLLRRHRARDAFDRLKSTSSLLSRAESGGKAEMTKIIRTTYGLQGIIRHIGMSQLLQGYQKPKDNQPPPKYKAHFPQVFPNPFLLTLISSPKLLAAPLTVNGPLYRSLVALYTKAVPRYVIRRNDPEILSKTKTIDFVEKKIEKIMAPMSFEMIRDLEARYSIAMENHYQVKQQEQHQQAESSHVSDRPPPPTKGPLHPSRSDFYRNQRRLYGFLLADLIAVVTSDQFKSAWKQAVISSPSTTPSAGQLPPLPTITPSNWLHRPQFKFSLKSIWCSKLRLTTNGNQDIYTGLNAILYDRGKTLPKTPISYPVKEEKAEQQNPDLIWIYKSPFALYPTAVSSSTHIPNRYSTAVEYSYRFVNQQEVEMAQEVLESKKEKKRSGNATQAEAHDKPSDKDTTDTTPSHST